MGDIGHQLAPLQVLLAQLLPLLAQALGHVTKAVLQDGQFIALAAAQRRRRRGGIGGGGIDIEGLDAPGQLAQRAGDPTERDQAGQQAHHRDDRQRPQRGAQRTVGGDVGRECFALFTDQHHVDVAGLMPLHPQRRRVEHLAASGAARVIAEDRQRLVAQQRLYRCQIDPAALEMTVRSIVAEDAALVVEQVDLHARVDRHQLAEQRAHFAVAHAAAIHQLATARDVFGQPAREALYGFLLMHRGAAHLDPHQRATAQQQQREEHRGQALRQREPDHAPPPSLPSTSL